MCAWATDAVLMRVMDDMSYFPVSALWLLVGMPQREEGFVPL